MCDEGVEVESVDREAELFQLRHVEGLAVLHDLGNALVFEEAVEVIDCGPVLSPRAAGAGAL